MLELTTLAMKSNRSKTLVAILLAALGSACGSSSGTSDTNLDGGGSTDARNSADSRTSTDARSSADRTDSVDGMSSPDEGTSTGDDETTADEGAMPDDVNADDNESAADDRVMDDDVTTTGTTPPVNLGTAGNYVVLTKTGISTVPPSVITGDIGASPIAAAAITGFSLIADSTNVFSTSKQVTGKVYAANYEPPTPSNLTTAIGDMQHAFTDAAGRAPDVTELGAGHIGGMTLPPGVYKWGTGVLIPTDVTLSGGATDVWIFQIAQTLTVSSAAKIVLNGGALPKNIFWQVAGAVDLGTTSHFEGVILTQTMIALETGASINGRLLAQTEVSLQKSTVVAP